MFITPAWAQDITNLGTETAEEGSILMSMLPLVLILLVFYLMVFRPQSKRIQAHHKLIDNLKKGDRVVTGGGLIGKVHKLTGTDELIIELAEGIKVHAVRSTITTLREKAVSNKEDLSNSNANDDDVENKKDNKKNNKKITVSKVRANKKKD